MANSRIGGMSFCGLHITNKDRNEEAYRLLDVDRPSSPNMSYREFSAPNRNGENRYDNRYEDIEISVVVGITGGSSIEKQTKITNLLRQWLGREDKLIFDDRPTLFYKAKIFAQSTSENEGLFTKLTIKFIASYCLYELYDDLRDYTVNQLSMAVNSMGMLVNKALWSNLSGTTIKQINNTGNFKAMPVIQVTGTADLVTIKIADRSCSFNRLASETIYVDSEHMVVYRVANDGKKISVLDRFYGQFPYIPTGISDVTIGLHPTANQVVMSVAVIIEFKNTYIC